MTLIPPNANPSFGTVVIPIGMIPLVVADPNNKTLLYANPGDPLNPGSARNLTLTVLWFHNTHATVTYTTAWAASYNSFVTYSPTATLLGSSDPGIELGWIDIPPRGIVVFDDPIVLAPAMGIFAWQAQKGTIAGPKAVTLHITGEWGPVQS